MQLISAPCALCGRSEHALICKCLITNEDSELGPANLDLVKCRKCGLVFTDPQPLFSSDELKTLYSRGYFHKGYMNYYAAEGVRMPQSNEPFSRRLDLIERYKKNGLMLEVGCASGEFLAIARKRGWQAQGVEISDYAADCALKKYNLEVFKGALEDAHFNPAHFDVVAAGDILEHMNDPRAFLQEAVRILKDDGILYLAAPDFSSFHYWLMSIVARRTHKNYFILPHHLYYFSPSTIRRLLEGAGFIVKRIIPSQSRYIGGGFKGFLVRAVYLIGRVLRKPDRMVVIAVKRGQNKE